MNITLFRWIVWLLVALCLAGLGYLAAVMAPKWNDRSEVVQPAAAESNPGSLGGPFSIVSHAGDPVTDPPTLAS